MDPGIQRFLGDGPQRVVADGRGWLAPDAEVDSRWILAGAAGGAALWTLPLLATLGGASSGLGDAVVPALLFTPVVALFSGFLVVQAVHRRRRRPIVADRGGVRSRSGFLPWADVADVAVESIELRAPVVSGEQAGPAGTVRYGLVFRLHGGGALAILLAGWDEAERVVAPLRALHQASAGAPQDIPAEIRALSAEPHARRAGVTTDGGD